MKILHNFHKFSRSKYQPGIRKKNTRKFLLGQNKKVLLLVDNAGGHNIKCLNPYFSYVFYFFNEITVSFIRRI